MPHNACFSLWPVWLNRCVARPVVYQKSGDGCCGLWHIRCAECEFVVICRRLDRLSMPLVSPFAKLFGLKVTLPKIHVATVKYGTSLDAPVSERWMYRGNDLYAAYDTKQVFKADNPVGLHSVLSRWHLEGRYQQRKSWRHYLPLLWLLPLFLVVKISELFYGQYDIETQRFAAQLPELDQVVEA